MTTEEISKRFLQFPDWNLILAQWLQLFFFVEKIVKSIFFLIGTVLSLALHEGMRTSLLKNGKEGLVYAGAIPLGILGIIFPQTINQVVLQIPPLKD